MTEVEECCTVKKEFSRLYYAWKGRNSKCCISLDILIKKNSSCSKEITVPWISKCFLGIKTINGVNYESKLRWKIWGALLPPKQQIPVSQSVYLAPVCLYIKKYLERSSVQCFMAITGAQVGRNAWRSCKWARCLHGESTRKRLWLSTSTIIESLVKVGSSFSQ